jgi:acyl-CoA synthetase (AMP-forming)/AMP-acid ligase II
MTALGDALLRHAQNKGDETAIDGGKSGRLSWSDFTGKVIKQTNYFAAHLGTTLRPVALNLDYGIAQAITDIALVEAGIASIPLPNFFTSEQRTHALMASGAQAIISARDDDHGAVAIESVTMPDVLLHAGTAKISFTSGSTGTPKGICLSADHMLGVAGAVVDYVSDAHAGRHLALLPPGTLLENVAGFYATLIAGGTYVALPQAEVGLGNAFAPDFLMMMRVIGEQAITSLILVPEYLLGLVTMMEMTDTRLPTLTLVAVGGARLSPDVIDRAVALGLPVRQGYGLTECGSVVALESADETKRGSVGQSLGQNRISLAEDGEILIDGPTYLGAIGFNRIDGVLHTGDIGRIDAEGRLWIEGRKSNLIITSHGRNISPEWVEGVLLAQPEIAQAMVYGEAASQLSALIVPATPIANIVSAVAIANAALPQYAKVGAWRMVAPFTPANGQLTANGRIRREAINAIHLSGEITLSFFDRLVAETKEAQQLFATVPQLQAGLAGRIDRATYIAYLIQAYHHVRHTVPLMQAARARLTHKPELVAALDDYIEEETGHEAWILNDIEFAGGDRQSAAASAPSKATAAMVDHAYATIINRNPAAFFGMVYVLEGTSIALATNGALAVQASLGLPPEAFSYLTSHGALDQEHMKFFEKLMNRISDPDDQQAIITMARDIFKLFAGVFASIPMEEFDEAA